MKIRILRGHIVPYVAKGGSWDEAKPDPASFEIEVGMQPAKGGYVIFTDPNAGDYIEVLNIGLIDDVVLVGAFTYVFVSSSRLA